MSTCVSTASQIYCTIKFDARSYPTIRRNRDRPRCAKLNIGQESFRDSLLFRWQLSAGRNAAKRFGKALSYRVFEEGRVIVNSRSVNRRKIRSEWFEFLSRETNGRHGSGILMRHAKYRGGESRLFSLFPRSRFLWPRCSYQGRTLRREYGKSIGRQKSSGESLTRLLYHVFC